MRLCVLLVTALTLGALPSIGTNDLDTVMSAGVEAYEQRRYAEAEQLLLTAVERAERHGLQDPRLILNLDTLGHVYREQGRYAEAELFYKRALAIREEILGLDHPDVAASFTQLAELYELQGKHAAAGELLQSAARVGQGMPIHEIIIVAVGLGSVFGTLVLGVFLVGRCPSCKRRWALKSTGRTRKERSFSLTQTLFVCKHCGHRKWRKDFTDLIPGSGPD